MVKSMNPKKDCGEIQYKYTVTRITKNILYHHVPAIWAYVYDQVRET